MSVRLPISVVASAFLAQAVYSGTSIEEEMVCPVGGEVFSVTSTLSCTFAGRTMSFRSTSSCDFVTRLPVCPSNGLPVYTEFTNENIRHLDQLIGTPDYDRIRSLPIWFRAYEISAYLGEDGPEKQFDLLISGYWFDTEAFLASDSMQDRFFEEAQNAMLELPPESKPFLQAILAYAGFLTGRVEIADKYLKEAQAATGKPEDLSTYLHLIDTCKTDLSRDGCRPEDRIKF